MIIIWRGAGIIVLAIVFGCNLIAQVVCNVLAGTTKYWESHAWPLALGFVASGSMTGYLGWLLEQRGRRSVVDPASGKTVMVRRPHELFFIPMKVWGGILLAIATFVFVTDAKPGPSRVRAAGAATHAPSR